jgi:CHAT domain-containing protein
MLPEVRLLTESEATENAIKQTTRPQILHIATHGFFLEDIELVASPDFSSTLFDQRSPVADVQLRPGFAPPSRTPINTENPLLRSGLALAGFNPRQSGTDDGVLTALEAAGLNLYGTKLVVLSACETGVGEVNNGEGVYGLRRAFTIAGAESQVMSLWKVSDEGTKDLMVSYYQRLLDNEGRSEALRQVQLEMLRSEQYQHPYFWASFIPSGDWTPMN